MLSIFHIVFSGLVQKAKKAKDKLLKRDGDERTDSSYESFYYGGVDPYMWEPQDLGKILTTKDRFKKKLRQARFFKIKIYKMQSKAAGPVSLGVNKSCHRQTVISLLLK